MLRSKQVIILFIFCLTFSHCSNSEETEDHLAVDVSNDVDMQLDQAMQNGMAVTDEDPRVQDAQHSDQEEMSNDQTAGGQMMGAEEELHTPEQSAGNESEVERDEASQMMNDMNLLIDPSFELNSSNWSIWGGANRADTDSNTGIWSLRATNQNGAEQRVTNLIPNATYRLSGWGKTESDEPMLIGVKNYGGEQVQLVFTQDEYMMDSLTFTMGSSNREAIVFAYKHRDRRPGYADDVRLTLETPLAPSEPSSELQLIWSDEFEGSGPLDESKWVFEEGFQRNQELQWYQSDNAYKQDGMLVIEGRQETRPNPTYRAGSTDWRTQREMIEFTSASIMTADRFQWQYGRLEVRAKVSNLTGTWPAIWTLGVSCEWPSSGEVDVMENYGGDILANFAWGTNQRWNAQWHGSRHPVNQLGANWADEFHIWTLDWDQDQMVIRVDGMILNRLDLNLSYNGSANCAGQNPFQQPHYLLLNLALGGAGGSVENLRFPAYYYVDYVRIYQSIEE